MPSQVVSGAVAVAANALVHPQTVIVDQPPQSMTLTLDNNDVARVLRVVGRAETDMDTACAIACSEASWRRQSVSVPR
jgi:hypothetical protein